MRSQRILKMIVLMLFALMASSAVMAQEYQILRAEYGAGNRWVDVTRQLQSIAASNPTFRMGNSTFGVDPAPGVVKSLRILARDGRGRERTFQYREGSTVDGSMFAGWGSGYWGGGGYGYDADAGQYRIVRAEYGAGNSWVDVTRRLREIASTDATFRMGNSTFDVDPAPGTVKSLRILARAPRGGMRTFEYREGSTVDGAMFSGWSRGDWGDGGFGGSYGGYGGYDRDAGQYRIMRAEYGAGNRWVDVTRRLRQIASTDATFRMGNSTFDVDPAPGALKTLRILARAPRGGTRTFEYREGSTVDGSLFTGWSRGDWGDGDRDDWRDRNDRRDEGGQYQIIKAEYGAGNRWVNVTQRLREIASSNTTFRMGNSTFGVDPAPGTVKVLRILAKDPRGGQRTFEYREGSTVDGAVFSGWSRGDWGW